MEEVREELKVLVTQDPWWMPNRRKLDWWQSL